MYLFLMFGCFLVSCSAKKKVSSNTVVVNSDTLTYVLPSENRLEVSTLCDSLNRPVEVLKTIDTGVSETTVQVKDNKLVVEVKTDTIFKDRIVYRDKLVEVDKEVVKYKIPTWVWLSYAGIFILGVGYFRFRKWL